MNKISLKCYYYRLFWKSLLVYVIFSFGHSALQPSSSVCYISNLLWIFIKFCITWIWCSQKSINWKHHKARLTFLKVPQKETGFEDLRNKGTIWHSSKIIRCQSHWKKATECSGWNSRLKIMWKLVQKNPFVLIKTIPLSNSVKSNKFIHKIYDYEVLFIMTYKLNSLAVGSFSS